MGSNSSSESFVDDRSPFFHCERREMLIAKDTTDCLGCPLKLFPTPCPQFRHWNLQLERGRLGYTPEIFDGRPRGSDITE
jgi:hypothetical protein